MTGISFAPAEIIRAGTPLACHPWPRHRLAADQWTALVTGLADHPAVELLALWADTVEIHALFRDPAADDFLLASVASIDGAYPALSPVRPAAAWFERMINDLWGHVATGSTDGRAWLDHGRWPASAPMSSRPVPTEGPPAPFEFLTAEGDDLHQVPVGPVHAGIIEPGHFRFHASGETVARLEIRLGYAHKGTLALMRGKSPRAAARFAARLSGDSTVAHSIAFARAAEAASGTEAPARADALRGVMAEIERMANHLGDIGAAVGDVVFPVLQARLVWHREALLRAAEAAFGHRLMMDCVIPGGIAADLTPNGEAAILHALDSLDAEFPSLLAVYDDTSSLAERLSGTGIVSADLAARFAAGGIVGRASGRAFDVRRNPGYPPYADIAPHVLEAGDVDARLRVRLAEIPASASLVRALLASLPEGPVSGPVSVSLPMASGEGIGWAEGFRGDIWHWLRLDGGMIASVFLRDPSWLQWPLLEAAMRGTIIADFPLCNKSFNCSYSGVDL